MASLLWPVWPSNSSSEIGTGVPGEFWRPLSAFRASAPRLFAAVLLDPLDCPSGAAFLTATDWILSLAIFGAKPISG